MEIADYEITTQELIPPLGNMYTHYAAISWVYIKTNEGNKRINVDLGEENGKSEEEAKNKMKIKFEAWLAEQP
ncbi:MAG: hypothetical protein OQK98_08410 [Gammaproteobacteria bacterium]|nr:hypothetical protein [Gammaproteobacteria bacterium]